MCFVILIALLAQQAHEPLVLKSGMILKCESIEKHGDWVLFTLSEKDERYEYTGSSNSFKIQMEKVDWKETDELKTCQEERRVATQRHNRLVGPAVLDQDSLKEYNRHQSKSTTHKQKKYPGILREAAPNNLYQQLYDAIQKEIQPLIKRRDDLEKEIIKLSRLVGTVGFEEAKEAIRKRILAKDIERTDLEAKISSLMDKEQEIIEEAARAGRPRPPSP